MSFCYSPLGIRFATEWEAGQSDRLRQESVGIVSLHHTGSILITTQHYVRRSRDDCISKRKDTGASF